jgi:hypothetical protein
MNFFERMGAKRGEQSRGVGAASFPQPQQHQHARKRRGKREREVTTSRTSITDASIFKAEGGHREHLDGSIAPVALSSKLGVGSRCYSKFNNGQWYWGCISEVSGKGHYARYAVDYDDGDTLGDIPWTDICSEKQHKEDFNEDPRPPPGSKQQHSGWQRTTMGQNVASLTSHENAALSLLDLRRRRCRQCVMCNKEDCGMCRSCQSNKGDTSIHKQVCLLKVNWPHHCYVCFCFYFRVVHFSPQPCRSDVHGFYYE